MQEILLIQTDNAVSKEEKDAYEAVGSVVTNARRVLDSLRLEQVLGKETVSMATSSELKTLLAQVDEYKKSNSNAASKLTSIYENDLHKTTRIAELEHRLHQLESAIGAKPDKLNRLAASLGTNSLLEAVQQLSTKAALLQPTQLDLIESRLANLATKMDAIASKTAASNQDATRDQKTIELYEIAKRTEPIAQILPDILSRMQALESLHSYGKQCEFIFAFIEMNFKKCLELEKALSFDIYFIVCYLIIKKKGLKQCYCFCCIFSYEFHKNYLRI